MDPIRYTVSFPAPHTHYAHVRAEVPTSGRDTVDLSMAVWTPGSYLVREYSRHVEGVAAESPDGSRLLVEKTAKNRWRITTGGSPVVIVTYSVYGREMSVRTNWIESGFAFLNGAPTFLTLAGDSSRPHEVTIVPAPGWTRSVTSLDAGPRDHVYCARDYDTLVDSPILVGNPAVHEFTVDGTPHLLVNEGDTAFFDADRAVSLELSLASCSKLAALVELRDQVLGLGLVVDEDVPGVELLLRRLGDAGVVLGLQFGLGRLRALRVLLEEQFRHRALADELEPGIRFACAELLLLGFLGAGVHADQLVERLFLFLGGQVARRLAGVARLDVQVPDVARNRRAIDHRNRLGRRDDWRVGLGAPGQQHAERGNGENLRMSHCVLDGESSSGETATMFRACISRGSIWASAS